MFAGVLDFLNGSGAVIVGVLIVFAFFVLIGDYSNETRKCNARHPRTGQRCNNKMHHWPEMHRTWGGKGWR